MTVSFWLRWKEQFENYGKAPTLNDYHNVLMQQISGVSQIECNSIAAALNKAIRSLSSDDIDWYTSLGNGVTQAANLTDIKDLTVSNKFQVSTPALSTAWHNYYAVANNVNTKMLLETEDISTINELKALKHKALSIQGRINHIKGQILETFLAGLTDTFSTISTMQASEVTNNLVELLKSGITNANFTNINSTEGALTSESVTITIDDEQFTLRGAKQKVDVTLPSPFNSGETWRISAKNYATLSNIHLLSGGSFLKLLYSGIQPQNNATFKFLLNALTIPSSSWTSTHLSQLKKIFMIQAMAGTDLNNMANVMVLTLNNNTNPFRIISISALLTSIFNNNKLDLITFTPNLDHNLPIGDTGPRTEQDIIAIKNFTVDATLSKAALSMSYLKSISI